MLHPYQVLQYIREHHRIDFDIYLFINTRSGGRVGMKFVTLEMETVTFIMHGLKISVSFFDQLNAKSRNLGLRKLKASEEMGIKCRAIVCGGDGTVLWVVRELIEHGIRIHNVPVGVIPIGTGNDFSRILGWGGKRQNMIGEKFQKLKQLVFQWIDAEIVNFDIWSVQVTTFENGYFKQISSRQEKMTDLKLVRRSFTNYCSIGIDGRIGWSFDKRRSKSRAINLMLYAWVGLLESCSSAIRMENIIRSMQHITSPTNLIQTNSFPMKASDNSPDQPQKPLTKLSSEKYKHSSKQIVFNSEPNSIHQLKKGYQNLVALNINSFMGGCHDMWQTNKLAVTNMDARQWQPQSYNDGLLEFVSWQSEMGLAFERLGHMASKVAQGPGPFVINFNPPQNEDDHIFLQVDGEFLKVYHPRQMIIEKCSKVPMGFIRVMKFRGRQREDFQTM